MTEVCRNAGAKPSWWFPDDHSEVIQLNPGAPEWDAPRIWCQACPARTACLELALQAEGQLRSRSRHGMFGGLSPVERFGVASARRRRQLRRERREQRAQAAAQAVAA